MIPDADQNPQPGSSPDAPRRDVVEEAERKAAAIAGLADSLIEYATSVKQEAGRLSRALADSLAESAPAATPVDADLSANAPLLSDGARLVATQMMVGGSSRNDIEERLRGDFGIEDTSTLLDSIFGAAGVDDD